MKCLLRVIWVIPRWRVTLGSGVELQCLLSTRMFDYSLRRYEAHVDLSFG